MPIIPIPLQHVFQIVLLCLGLSALLTQMVFRPQADSIRRKVLLATMGVVAVVSLASYSNWGQRHRYGTDGYYWYHYHDIYHYLIGAKYYPELGYERLYECSWLAMQELESESGVKVPKVTRVRSLADPDVFFDPARQRDRLDTECHQAFAPERWAELKTDQRAWLENHFWQDGWWSTLLGDMGFNPPPTWNVIAYPIAQLGGTITRPKLNAYPHVDIWMLFGIGGIFVYRAYGAWGLATYFLVLGTNWLATYRWTGGSYCRQLWFAFLVYGVCLLQLKKYAWAGAALAASVCMRLFPAFFVIGAGIALLRLAIADKDQRRPLLEFSGAGIAVGLGFFVASLAMFDSALWTEFFQKMDHHSHAYFTWHIGFRKWATFYPDLIGQPKNYMVANGPRLELYSRYLDSLYDQHWLRNEGIRWTMMLGSLAAAWRRPPAQAAMIVGTVLLFCTSMPANYYYVYLALLPVVFFRLEGGVAASLRMFLVFAMLLAVSLSAYAFRPNDSLAQNGMILISIFWFLVLFLATFAGEEIARWRSGEAPEQSA